MFDFILHVDSRLELLIAQLGPLSYLALFLIIFAETGLVITPFLPGDSLLFAVGALAASGLLNVWVVLILLFVAAVLGDSVNYWIGSHFGARAFAKKNARFFKPEYLKQTQDFYARHGGKTIVLARFIPIVRTFAPFVAGVGKMRYPLFIAYNVAGAFIWVVGLVMIGYFFGLIPAVKENFEYTIIAIVVVSVLPPIVEVLRHKRKYRRSQLEGKTLKRDLEEVLETKDLD